MPPRVAEESPPAVVLVAAPVPRREALATPIPDVAELPVPNPPPPLRDSGWVVAASLVPPSPASAALSVAATWVASALRRYTTRMSPPAPGRSSAVTS